MTKLSLEDIRRARAKPGRSALLYITDRCPVGCGHCSVAARVDSAMVSDFELFGRLVEGLCGRGRLQVVGISGGEPFIERRALAHAVNKLSESGKDAVVYTSGLWGSTHPPSWIEEVLGRASTVFLSTDRFHRAFVSDDQFVYAAKAVVSAGTPLVVPILKSPDEMKAAASLLLRAFGPEWEAHAELEYNPPLAYGRGASVFHQPERRPPSSLGLCALVASPVVRYDGRVTACCNEQVIVGKGPAQLARQAATPDDVELALDEFERTPLLRLLATVGGGPLVEYDGFKDLAASDFSSICELCWAMHERMPAPRSERVLGALAVLVDKGRG